MKKRIIGIAILSALLFVSIALILWQSESKSNATKLAIHHSGLVHQGLRDVLVLVSQSESYSRSYVLSGNKVFLEKVQEVNDQIQPKLQYVIPLTTDKLQREAMSKVVMLIGQKVQLNDELIEKSLVSLDAARLQVNSLKGKVLFDEINDLFNYVSQREYVALALKLKDLHHQRQLWNVLMVFLGFSFLALIAYLLRGALKDYHEVKRLETIQHFMVNSNKNGFILIDTQNKLVSFNDAALRCIVDDVSRIPVTGSDVLQYLPAGHSEAISRAIEQAKDGEKTKLLVDVASQNKVRYYSFTFYPIVFNGAIIYVNIVSHEITETRQREIELQEYKNKTNALLESTHEAIFLLSKTGEVQLMNKMAPRLLDILYSKKVEVGQHFEDVFTGEGRQIFRESFGRAANGERVELELPIRIEGKLLWFMVIISPVMADNGEITGMSVISVDITEKKRSEKAIQRSEQMLRSLINSVQDAFLMMDPNHNILVMNEPARLIVNQVIGYDVKIGEPLLPHLTGVHTERLLKQSLRCLKGEFFQSVEEAAAGDMEFWLRSSWGPVYNAKGEIFGYSLYMVDVTQEKKRQEELLKAREMAENAEKLQQQFLANMSHEIRTPLNGIVGMANLLSKTDLDPTQKHYMDVVRYSSDNLLVLINDILDLSKIKANKFHVDNVNFNIYDLLRNASASFQARAEDKGLQFSVSVNPYISKNLCGDPHRLVQVLNNLLGNALKFTPGGFIKLEARIKERAEDREVLEFIVSDSGIGIAEDQLQNVFEAFAQEESSISKTYGGTGLGLAICKHLVELQGGSIHVTSEKGVGTQFTFTIPYKVIREEVMLDLPKPQAVNEKAGERKTYPGKRVLIIEDNEINQKVLALNLRQFDIEVHSAMDGQEGVDLLRKDSNFDMVLLDLRMPRMDGMEVLRIVRNELKLSLPIVVLTASVLKNEKIHCYELGANDYMAKPFSQAQIESCLERFFSSNANSQPVEFTSIEDESSSIKYSFDNLRALNDKESVRSLLDQFGRHVPEALHELETLAADKQWKEVAQKVHKLKSSFGIVYINSIFELLQQVEVAIKIENDPSDVLRKITKARNLFNKYYPSIEENVHETMGLSLQDAAC